MNRKLIESQYIELVTKSLSKMSKFYEEDKAAIVKAAKKKTLAELQLALSRQRAIANVSKEEIKVHCQFKF